MMIWTKNRVISVAVAVTVSACQLLLLLLHACGAYELCSRALSAFSREAGVTLIIRNIFYIYTIKVSWVLGLIYNN